jgi:uncharacterized protein YuzE
MRYQLSSHARGEAGRRGRIAMKVIYDEAVDVIRILFNDREIEESDEAKPGVIFDYDKDGRVVGLEILDASEQMENPKSVEYAVAG